MKVPLLDLKGQYAPLRAEIEAVIREVCDSQRFVLGPHVTELEKEVAAYSQAAYGIGISSGTDALLVALITAFGLAAAGRAPAAEWEAFVDAISLPQP